MATTTEVLAQLTARCDSLRESGGTRLPSERTLAKELNASRSTVRRALTVLAEAGVITVTRGRNGGASLRREAMTEEGLLATWSTNGDKVTRSLKAVADIPQTLAERGLDVGIRVLSLALEAPTPFVASQLGIGPGEPVVTLLRVRFANGAPLSLERMHLSFERFPRLVEDGLGGVTSMYVLLDERFGVAIASIEEEIEIAAASPEEAHLLTIKPGDPVLVLRRLALDSDGRPVEYSQDLFRGDRARFTVRTGDPALHATGNSLGVDLDPKPRAGG